MKPPVRSSGLLLHPTSLPGPHGIGDLGPAAFAFADFLARAGQRLWQMLPLTPTSGAHGHSPYHSASAFAGNPLLVSPEALVAQGLLRSAEVPPAAAGEAPAPRVDFRRAERLKRRLLPLAAARFAGAGDTAAFARFCHRNGWLDDFSLFAALREHFHPRPWPEWPAPLRDRQPEPLAEARRRFRDAIRREKILQFLFYRQWSDLKAHCHRQGVRLMGDLPIYVPLDSADVWAHRRCFQLDRRGRPRAVSGVPPDYFSATGQLWGHPLYDWEALAAEGYDWWLERLAHNARLYDLTRIDHFRGLVGYWAVPSGARTAVRGRWVPAPAVDFFDRALKRLGSLPLVAEDLGTITAEVREVMRRYGLPGMRVLLFAFGDDFPRSAYLPHHHEPNCVVYTGTHDNNTARGWFETEADPSSRRNLFRYLGREVTAAEAPWELVRLALMSPAAMAVIPLQDVLGLGPEARMNRPARRRGNWLWRCAPEALSAAAAERLRDVTAAYDRL